MYKIDTDPMTNEITYSYTNGQTIHYFKENDANVEYIKYIKWVQEGNIAEEWNPNANQ